MRTPIRGVPYARHLDPHLAIGYCEHEHYTTTSREMTKWYRNVSDVGWSCADPAHRAPT